MFAYIVRRILATIPVMAVVALFVFALLLSRARAIRRRSSPATRRPPSDIDRIREQLGLDQPFLVQFGDWVWQLAARRSRHLDLHQPAGHQPDRAAASSRRCR